MEEFLQEKNADANSILKADEKLTEADKKMAGKTLPPCGFSQSVQSRDFQPIKINLLTRSFL